MMARPHWLALVLPMFSLSAHAADWPEGVVADYGALSEGVGEIVHGESAPGELVLYGERSFPVVVDPEGKPFVAASRLGEGRVAAFSHTLYFGNTALDAPSGQGRLLANALRWAAGSETPVVAIAPSLPELEAFLSARGWRYWIAEGPDELADADVFCAGANLGWSRPDLNAARAWVEGGRGLLTAGTPWAYSVDRHATELAGNRLLSGSGLVFAEGYTWPDTNEVRVPVDPPSPLTTAAIALAAMVDHVEGRAEMPLEDQRVAARSLSSAIRWLPWRFDFFDDVDSLRSGSSDAFIISPENPLRKAEQPVRRVLAELEMKLAEERPATQVSASPSAVSWNEARDCVGVPTASFPFSISARASRWPRRRIRSERIFSCRAPRESR